VDLWICGKKKKSRFKAAKLEKVDYDFAFFKYDKPINMAPKRVRIKKI
jgi:hypothetical protein